MNADDFQDLYKLLRGSRSALTVLDARGLFSEKKYPEAHAKLVEARESFAGSRSRVLKQDADKQIDAKGKDADKQRKILQRKQDKTLETLKAFDELIPRLERMAARVLARQAEESSQPAAETPPSELAVACPADISADLAASFVRADADRRLDIVNEGFHFREVKSDADIHGNAIYFIRTGRTSLLVQTPALTEMADQVALVSAVDNQPIKPFSRADFVRLGTRRKMVLLVKKAFAETSADPAVGADDDDEDNDDDRDLPQPDLDAETDSDGEGESEGEGEQNVLDMGAFSQLLTSAQRCGLVPGADQIGHVRDREFRLGKYELAFQAIDALFSRFSASMNERSQRLTREDAEIAAGRIKMSPKDLQAKRARDRMQTQEVERTRRRFQVVLEGLRMLMNPS